MDDKKPLDPKRVLQILEFKRRTLSFVESMLVENISIEQLSQGETIICQRDFDDIVQERFLLRLCGYPLCCNRLEKEWNQKYLVSPKNKKVYEVEERKLYCSLKCMNTAKKYRNDKLPEQPIWMRLDEIKIDPKIEVKLPGNSNSQERSSVGESLGNINMTTINLNKQVEDPAPCGRHMPWFGLDIGGSLVKVVFFDPDKTHPDEEQILNRTRLYLKTSKAYGTTGKRDEHLEMPNCVIDKREGTLHFIRFATSQMSEFIKMSKDKGLADLIKDVCATGGGAYKFEEEIKTNLNILLRKSDEFDSLICGINYIDKYNGARECYYIQEPLDVSKCQKVPYDFSQPYPYLVVNIGSGVSILAVYSPTSYSRIEGSSIGGGTFEGLCCLLTQKQITFDEAIRMAEAGSSTKVDKLVKDIYGGDYEKFNLKGDLVASSFGNMNNQERRSQAKPEDYARGVLEFVTLNIASIARLCASKEKIDRVVFIGNFLRVNQLSLKLLSYALNYWSKGEMKALFLEHEGYFGAVGCLAESTQSLI